MKTVLRYPMKALTLVAIAIAGVSQAASAQSSGPLSPLWSFTYALEGATSSQVNYGVGRTGVSVFIFEMSSVPYCRVLVLSSKGLKLAEGTIPSTDIPVVGSKTFLVENRRTVAAYGFANGSIFPVASLDIDEDSNPSDEFTDRQTYWEKGVIDTLVTFDYNNDRTKVKITRYRE
jgi:hypothetical protein